MGDGIMENLKYMADIVAVVLGVIGFKYIFESKNAYEVFCDDIEKKFKKGIKDKNIVTFTKEELNAKSQEELTQIKIEAATFEYTTYISNNMGLLALLISVITLINTMISGKNFIDSFNIFCLLALLIYVIIVLINLLRFKNAQKWRKYILAVIDELIEKNQIQDQMYTYEIEIEDSLTHEKTVYTEKIKKTKY